MHGGHGEETEIEIETELIRAAASDLTDEPIDMERIDSVRPRDVRAQQPEHGEG